MEPPIWKSSNRWSCVLLKAEQPPWIYLLSPTIPHILKLLLKCISVISVIVSVVWWSGWVSYSFATHSALWRTEIREYEGWHKCLEMKLRDWLLLQIFGLDYLSLREMLLYYYDFCLFSWYSLSFWKYLKKTPQNKQPTPHKNKETNSEPPNTTPHAKLEFWNSNITSEIDTILSPCVFKVMPLEKWHLSVVLTWFGFPQLGWLSNCLNVLCNNKGWGDSMAVVTSFLIVTFQNIKGNVLINSLVSWQLCLLPCHTSTVKGVRGRPRQVICFYVLESYFIQTEKWKRYFPLNWIFLFIILILPGLPPPTLCLEMNVWP